MIEENTSAAGAPGNPKARAKHDRTPPAALLEFMTTGWEQPERPEVSPISGVDLYQARRQAVSERFPGMLVVVPSGVGQTRANDTEYRFRPSTDFLYLVGEGEPDEVLVLEPLPDGGHVARLYAEPEADFSHSEFFTDRVKGIFWVGPRRGLAATSTRFGLEARRVAELKSTLQAHDQGLVLRGVDPRVDALAQDLAGPDQELQTHLSEMRLIKDDLEVDLLQDAVDLTRLAFEDVVSVLPEAKTERDVEVAFFRRARSQGNDTGYLTIAAAGSHATILHWSHNTGQVRPGELLLLDAGVESNRYYTADVTRTLPISGHFTTPQRRVYELVWRAQQAGFAAVRPGEDFLAPNRAAQAVLARGLEEMGILPVSAEESLRPESQLHQRYTLHGVSHMLGLDVHDCAHSRQENYTEGRLEPGMVLTVEPGLYFQPNDGTVPAELRGIGVRIEDDVVVTKDGCRVLSAGLPSHPDQVEAWMAEIWAGRRR
ncbi:MAG TPA: aminopeptidase P family protein [Candidatus Nanopelagicaceae bacterium]|nr:aminopeptidase P family protein [Candidatus Nanopelagicaceae bacterium]